MMNGEKKVIRVTDHNELIEIHFNDVLKYHGPFMNAGAAISFQWLRLAFQEVFGSVPPERDELRVITGHTGLGVLDAIEFVTRAMTRNRLTIDINIEQGQYNPYVKGGFFFQLNYRNDPRTAHILRPNLIPVDFYTMWFDIREGKASDELVRELFVLRNQLKDQVMAAEPADLFIPAELVPNK